MKIQDHLGRTVSISRKPRRIISFVPAITETMYHLGLDEEIVGRTRFCKFPKDKVKNAIDIGGTKDMKLERIQALKPDVIIAEKEENTKEMVETLEKHFPVFVFEVQHYEDIFRMLQDLGRLTDREAQAAELTAQIQTAFQNVSPKGEARISYVIWQRPYMVVGKDTYINSILEELGFQNPFIEKEGRYPEVTIEDFKEANLDEIFLATEPFPFRDKHVEEFRKLIPGVKVTIIDGEMFWYGVKMIEAAKYFKTFHE